MGLEMSVTFFATIGPEVPLLEHALAQVTWCHSSRMTENAAVTSVHIYVAVTCMMWHETCLWNFNVLQRVHFFDLVS
jgi:hypothetical protein